MPASSYFDEFQSKYDKPQVDGLIVGFSGIDPQKKGNGDDSCNCNQSTFSDSQLNLLLDIIQNEFNNFNFNSNPPNCNCDWSTLSDEQKDIVIQLLNSRLTGLKFKYDGGEITLDDDYTDDEDYYDDNPPQDSDQGDFTFETEHELLKGLLGGNSEGHYHLTADELTKIVAVKFCWTKSIVLRPR